MIKKYHSYHVSYQGFVSKTDNIIMDCSIASINVACLVMPDIFLNFSGLPFLQGPLRSEGTEGGLCLNRSRKAGEIDEKKVA